MVHYKCRWCGVVFWKHGYDSLREAIDRADATVLHPCEDRNERRGIADLIGARKDDDE